MTIIKMRVNEKTRQQTWKVLQEIEEELSVTPKDKPVKYKIPNVIGSGVIPRERIVRIIEKLEEEGAFKIRRRDDGVRIGTKDRYELIVNRSDFYKIYERYRPAAVEPEETLDYTDNSLRQEYEKKWEVIKILKSNLVAKEHPKNLMIWAKSFIRGEVKTLGDAASYFAVFQQSGCFKKYGLEKSGQYYVFVDVDRNKLLETHMIVGKHYKRFAEEYQKTHPPKPPTPFDWTTVSQKSLLLAKKVVEIITDYFAFGNINRLDYNRIPLSKFESEQIHLEEVVRVLSVIDGIKVANGALQKLSKQVKKRNYTVRSSDGYPISDYFPSDEDLRNYVFLQISTLDGLQQVRKIIDEKINYLDIVGQTKNVITEPLKSKYLKSVHLVTETLEPSKVIFLVLDEHYDIPIRCSVKNSSGETTYIKKLYDIAYLADVPGKKTPYNKNLADSINNGLFRKRAVAKYIRTNQLKKPTLVQRSEDKEILVLKNEVPIKTVLVKQIPVQHQSLYKDKTQ